MAIILAMLLITLIILNCVGFLFPRTMVRGEEMAASYITSRICVVNYTDGPDTLHDLRYTIESRHPLPATAIYNLTQSTFPLQRFPNATVSFILYFVHDSKFSVFYLVERNAPLMRF